MWHLFHRVIYSNNFWVVRFLSFGSADRRLVSIIGISAVYAVPASRYICKSLLLSRVWFVPFFRFI